MPRASEIGAEAEKEHQRAVERGTLPDSTKKQRKRRPDQRLRVVDPW